MVIGSEIIDNKQDSNSKEDISALKFHKPEIVTKPKLRQSYDWLPLYYTIIQHHDARYQMISYDSSSIVKI